jgi:hypothetical protein
MYGRSFLKITDVYFGNAIARTLEHLLPNVSECLVLKQSDIIKTCRGGRGLILGKDACGLEEGLHYAVKLVKILRMFENEKL